MPNVYKPGLLQIKPMYEVDVDSGDHPLNVTWWQSTTLSTPGLADLTTLAAVFDFYWSAMWSTLGSSAKHYEGCLITDWSSNTGLEYSSVGVWTPTAGSHSGGLAPPNVAVLLSYNSGERFRGGHFRTYFPYIGNVIITGANSDTVDPAFINGATTAFVSLGTGMNGSGVLGGQSQRLYRHRGSPTLAQLYQIKSFGFQSRLASQRRRLRKAAHR